MTPEGDDDDEDMEISCPTFKADFEDGTTQLRDVEFIQLIDPPVHKDDKSTQKHNKPA